MSFVCALLFIKNILMRLKLKVKFVEPEITSFSKKEVEEHIAVSASCKIALCGIGGTYTCNKNQSYSCDYYDGSPINCPKGDGYTCGANNLHQNR